MFTKSSEATTTFKIENTAIASKFPSYPLAISYTHPHIPHRHTQIPDIFGYYLHICSFAFSWISYYWTHTIYTTFKTGLFSRYQLLHVSVICPSRLLSNIPLSGHTTSCLYISLTDQYLGCFHFLGYYLLPGICVNLCFHFSWIILWSRITIFCSNIYLYL